ncbi:MAG: VOC family protein [Acidobacteriaceae bacterium]|nr:VOC family protein [Acidobacteriaceae bacterium]
MLKLKLHHIGLCVDNIERHRPIYTAVGYAERTDVIHDPAQTAYVQFFLLSGADHYLELVAPDGPESKLARAVKKNQLLNHLCYAVSDVAETCRSLEKAGWRLISEPEPAVAFEGRSIAWIASPDMLIVELVEAGPPGSL